MEIKREDGMLHGEIAFKLKELKADDDYFYFTGYAAVFNNVDLGRDLIEPGAFKKSLKQKMPKLCYQHKMHEPLGVIDTAKEDATGLYVEGRMPKDNTMCKDVASLLKIGAIDSFSIGYTTVEAEVRKDGVRVLKELDLWEVSFVTVPMNPKAKITGVKNIGEIKELVKTQRDFENVLRESGAFSKEACVWLASHFMPEPSESETAESEAKAQTKTEIENELSLFYGNLKSFAKSQGEKQ